MLINIKSPVVYSAGDGLTLGYTENPKVVWLKLS